MKVADNGGDEDKSFTDSDEVFQNVDWVVIKIVLNYLVK